jgi:hypothetical protein
LCSRLARVCCSSVNNQWRVGMPDYSQMLPYMLSALCLHTSFQWRETCTFSICGAGFGGEPPPPKEMPHLQVSLMNRTFVKGGLHIPTAGTQQNWGAVSGTSAPFTSVVYTLRNETMGCGGSGFF